MFSIDFPCDKFNIIVEAEDAGDEQEGLGHVDQQTVRNVVDHDDLIRYQRNTAHDEQHRTGILRDFKSCVFHSIRFIYIRVCAPAPPKRPAQIAAIISRMSFTVLFIIVCVFNLLITRVIFVV